MIEKALAFFGLVWLMDAIGVMAVAILVMIYVIAEEINEQA